MDQTLKNSPRVWTLESYFPTFGGPEMTAFKERLHRDIRQLIQTAQRLPDLGSESASDWEKIILAMEDAQARLDHWSSYVSCLEAAHADDEIYPQERAVINQERAALERIDIELVRAFQTASSSSFEGFRRREPLRAIAYALEKIRTRSHYALEPGTERLASDLNLDGIQAWGRLYNRLSGKLRFEYQLPDGNTAVKPISQWRSLMAHPDRKVGRAVFEGGNRAWQGIEDACAAALNAIAGTRLTLDRHRGRPDYLDEALFKAGIQKRTLDAMYDAVRACIDLPREFLKTKAAAMGRGAIAFFEREAPLANAAGEALSWPEGIDLVARAFTDVYPALGVHFRHMLRSGWIESEARDNKRPGAFCTRSPRTGEQRVYMTFNGTLGDVTTLAHEVGHAWHGHLLRTLRPWAQRYPMTLAETASIFAEQILAEGLYNHRDVDDGDKLAMLDEDLSGMAVLLLDITTRFEFESAFYRERQEGELGVSRLKALMVAAQQQTYGDALAPGGEDPYFWASKLHFYISDLAFYNFPYTFGFLLARALIARFKKEGRAFLPRYETFLAASASASVEQVVFDTLGQDITRKVFWLDAIRSLDDDLARFRQLLSQQT
jgi:oligoendopeptidase F